MIAVMLLVYVPTVRSYLNLRQAFAEACQDLDRQLLVRRFEFYAVREMAEYFDVAMVEEERSELQTMAAAASDVLDDLRIGAAGLQTLASDVERLERAHGQLQEDGLRALKSASNGRLEARLEMFRDATAPWRNDQLQSIVDAILSQDSLVFEARLSAISGQLLSVPFLDLEVGAMRLRAGAAEAIAAATFAQHLERLVLEYQGFAFLDGAWHKLYLARGRAEQSHDLWLGTTDATTGESAIPLEQSRELSSRFRELKQLGDRLVDFTEAASKAEVLRFYEDDVQLLTDETLSPVLESILANYQAQVEARARSLWRQIDLAGYVLAVFGLIVLALALVSPRLMSRWIVQPVSTLTHATRKLGAGDLSEPVVISSTDELGELATCFNQMVVDLKEAEEQLGRRERLVVLGQLSGSVAHEIRNPLGVMKNSIYFLRLTQRLKDEKAMQHLGLIEDEITRANRIISELLDYARDPTAQPEGMVLQEAFYRALAEVEIPESVHVEHTFEEEPLKVMGDSGQIERILANFMRNAVQAMPDGGELTMECRRDGDEMIARVGDTGVGMTEAEVGRIFEPLYTGKAKGIGLGLPLSLRYANLNSGRIECQSKVGEGSTFTLILPASAD